MHDNIGHSSQTACLCIRLILCLRFTKEIEISKKIICFLDIKINIIKIIIIKLAKSGKYLYEHKQNEHLIITCLVSILCFEIILCIRDNGNRSLPVLLMNHCIF